MIIGEVGLAGEVRTVSYLEKRVKEAAKLGFSKAIVPYENYEELSRISKIKIIGVKMFEKRLK